MLRQFAILVLAALGLSSVTAAHATNITLVPTGAVWRYLDTGSDQGAAWRSSSFDDSSWASGPAELGYGDGAEATVVSYGPDATRKYITTYFRRAFTVEDAAAFTTLNMRVVRDDGIVVYLNGAEVYRNNMPSGTISYTTLASSAIGDTSETAFNSVALNPASLVEGANVLAVEIHQSSASSSDISFNLELTGERPQIQIAANTPSHGAIGVGLSPTLAVDVSHRDNLPMTVTFHGRAAPPVGPDFTVVALPDTQFYTSGLNGGSPAIFNAQTDWIVANTLSRNIVFVTQLGDCTQNGDNGGNDIEWRHATNALYRLENPATTFFTHGIPYGVAVGNHDQSPTGSASGTTRFYNQYFGEAHFMGRPYYGGHYSTNNDDHFELFSASGIDFIVIHFEYDTAITTASPELAWADQLLQTYSHRQAIIVSHWIMNSGENGSFSAQGQAIYNRLRVHPNLFLMLCGHVNPNGEGKRTDIYNGNTVYTVLSDYQDRVNGGNGWLRTMEFSPANSVIRVRTFSPTLMQYETDANSQFDLHYDMQSLIGNPFGTVAVNTAVPSGNTTTEWQNLAVSTEYEWYVSVSDGVETVQSPIWRFRTADATLPAAPSGLTASPHSSSEIILSWIDNSTNEFGFELLQSLDGLSFSTIGTVEADLTGTIVAGLQPATTYHYRVSSFNDAGRSDPSASASATTMPPPPPPAAPTALAATAASTSQITLNWSDNADNEVGFRIERSTDGVTFSEINTVAANVSIYSDANLAAGTLYSYRVRAYNDGGTSDYSNVAGTMTQPPPPPPAPVGLAAVAGDHRVALTWEESPGADDYFIYRADASGGPYTRIAYGISATSYEDTGLVPHVNYFYRATARNAGGESAFSNEAVAAALGLPAPPTDATVYWFELAALELSWVDNALDETGYALERSLDGTSFVLITNLPPDVTSYRDENLLDNTTYYYRIRAFNDDGTSAGAETSGTTLIRLPNAPGNLTATAVSSSQINLVWTDNADNETGFELERKIGANGAWTLLAALSANTTGHTDGGLSANTTYHYRIRALNSGGHSAYSAEASATSFVQQTTVTFTSIGAEDGYITESSETSNLGGTASATANNTSALRAGDTSKDQQIRSFLSFDTSSLPDGATIVSATLKLKRGTVSGTVPFTTHGACNVDIKGGSGFGGAAGLSAADFQAAADATGVATLSSATSNGQWSTGSLNAISLSVINKTGRTQFRVYFSLDDDDDRGNDYIGWYSGENSTQANRPVLEIVYH